MVHDPLARRDVHGACAAAARAATASPIRVRPPAALPQALVGTGFEYTAEQRARQARLLARVLPAVRDVRRFGAARSTSAGSRPGRFDGYFETGLKPWDRAAGEMIVARGRRRGGGHRPRTAWWPAARTSSVRCARWSTTGEVSEGEPARGGSGRSTPSARRRS